MDLPRLYDGHILARYKRFLADVQLAAGATVTAHCPNTGSMHGCWRPGAPVQLSRSSDPRRKLAWTLERVDMGAGWIGVNTHRVNSVIAEAAEAGRLPGLERLRRVNREVRVPFPQGASSRLDLLLEGEGCRAYVEVKNTTLLDDGRLCFPDAVSVRARKHLEALQALAAAGSRAVILFALNRPEGSAFAPADAIDPGYGRALRQTVAEGVEVLALRLVHGARSISVARPVPVEL
jgi:sugar fermentation stimulation protein A